MRSKRLAHCLKNGVHNIITKGQIIMVKKHEEETKIEEIISEEDDADIGREHYMWQYIKFCTLQTLLENNGNNPKKVFDLLNRLSASVFDKGFPDDELLYHLHIAKKAIDEGYDFCRNTIRRKKRKMPINIDIWGTSWSMDIYEQRKNLA